MARAEFVYITYTILAMTYKHHVVNSRALCKMAAREEDAYLSEEQWRRYIGT